MIKKFLKVKSNSTDAMLLAFVRILTLGTGILSSAILSRALELNEYGTYVSGNLLITSMSLLTICGLMDASNYFFHYDEQKKQEYISTIVGLEIVIGIGCAILLLLGKEFVIRYFDNNSLKYIYGLIVFRPMTTNLINIFLTLQTAIGKAKTIAVRNVVFAVAKLMTVFGVAYINTDITLLFGVFLLLDVMTIVFYYNSFAQTAFHIRVCKMEKQLVVPILRYSIPMGVYILMTYVMRDIDKYIIAAYESTENLAIYANCATLLPFDFISSAFITVSLPIITKLVQNKKLEKAHNVYKAYLKIGYLSNVTFTVISMVLAEELILLLYGEKYLPGVTIFILYLIVDAVKFAGTTIVLTAFGKTRMLMGISTIMMLANIVLNFVFYKVFGFVGPALATVIIVVISALVILRKGAENLQCKVFRLFDIKHLLTYLGEVMVFAFVAKSMNTLLISWNVFYVIRLLAAGGVFGIAILSLQYKNIMFAMKQINNVKLDIQAKEVR